MTRPILDEQHIHPAVRDKVDGNHRDIVDEVQRAIAEHPLVVVGMAQNPYPRRARKLLDKRGTKYHYLEYGSYVSAWRRRTALKMWSGWPTFPMIFLHGTLIGGFEDLEKLIASGDFDTLLSTRP